MIVPGRKVYIDVKDTSSAVMGGRVSFEVGLVDFGAGCRLDFEEYVITDPTITSDRALTSALAHYHATLLEYGVVGDWLVHSEMVAPRQSGLTPLLSWLAQQGARIPWCSQRSKAAV